MPASIQPSNNPKTHQQLLDRARKGETIEISDDQFRTALQSYIRQAMEFRGSNPHLREYSGHIPWGTQQPKNEIPVGSFPDAVPMRDIVTGDVFGEEVLSKNDLMAWLGKDGLIYIKEKTSDADGRPMIEGWYTLPLPTTLTAADLFGHQSPGPIGKVKEFFDPDRSDYLVQVRYRLSGSAPGDDQKAVQRAQSSPSSKVDGDWFSADGDVIPPK